MIILHQIRQPLDNRFEKWYIVRKLDEDIKNDDYKYAPQLSPSQQLFDMHRKYRDSGQWNQKTFIEKYVPVFLNEMKQSQPADDLKKLAELSKSKDIALCCYCDDERICHRSIVGGILKGLGAEIESSDDYLKYYTMYSTC